MPKYQIILSSNEQLTDQEFQKYLEDLIDKQPSTFNTTRFIIESAQNLEGIREELWQQKEEIKNFTTRNTYFKQVMEDKIENSFEEINKLFKF